MNNKQISHALHQLADYLELAGENSFKVGAYRKAARAVETSRESIAEHIDHVQELKGVGKGTASVIRELVETGRLSQLEELQNSLPEGLPDLLALQGLGPKTIYTLYKELGITTQEQLREAAQLGKIKKLSGFGAKKEQKILEAIENFEQRPDRILLYHALYVARTLKKYLSEMDGIEQMELAGSIRRGKETIKDLDFVIATDQPEEVGEQIVQLPVVKEVTNQGSTKVSVWVEVEGIIISVDFRLVTSAQFASALHHFTGSKEHNVRIRQRAKQLGYKVSEYGIFHEETEQMITFADEKEFYNHLQLPFISPELREDRGEIEAADEKRLPELIETQEYRGDLHMHTLYSDGAHRIREMAEAAKLMSYEYIAITDHSQSLQVANGLKIDDLREQWKEIDQINQELEGIKILKGTEVDILSDGQLDFPDEILQELDVVVASIHTHFKQDIETMTNRIIKAMENPFVHIIGHPTGRLLLRRDAYEVDLERIFQQLEIQGPFWSVMLVLLVWI